MNKRNCHSFIEPLSWTRDLITLQNDITRLSVSCGYALQME